ncbi:MAG TPA: PIN domain-containing protein [Verrucomicrobiae bacterium]|nr:PIN domain-containing protein [Verrucomicrobiae bacterium]
MGKTYAAAAAPAGITLDAGALTALDRGDKRLIALLDRALAQRLTFRVPSGVVGQAWRDGRVQLTLARFLRADEVEIIPLDEQLARACGELCDASNTSDIIDASVVILARGRGDRIVTSDPHDLRRLDPTCQIIPI